MIDINRIKLLREELNLSQEEFGKLVKLSKGMVSLVENGKRKPSLDSLKRMSELFNCSMDYIMGGETEEIDLTNLLLGMSGNKDKTITPEKIEKIKKVTRLIIDDEL